MLYPESQLKIYSLAVVAEDYRDRNGEITATPIEFITMAENKKLNDLKNEIETEFKDIKGNTEKSKAIKSANITAKWLNFGISNRATPPTVYKGETVILFRYEEEDTYYWTTLFNEPRLRKLEEAVYYYSDVNSNEPKKEATPDNSYTFYISTKQKIIGMSTSKSDGEAVKYKVTFDLKKSRFDLEDDRDNRITIQSLENIITISSNGNSININGAAGIIDISAKSLINISAPTVICRGKKC